ncbi:Metalloprotease PmbA [compost metagenome]
MESTFDQLPVGPDDLPTLKQRVQDVLDEARRQGVGACEALALRSEQKSQSVAGEAAGPADIQRQHLLGLALYVDGRKGEVLHELGDDFSPAEAVAQALAIARAANADPHLGLAEADSLAWDYPDLDLYQDWPTQAETLLDMARICDQSALQTDARIVGSRGTTLSGQARSQVFGNSHGFLAGYCHSQFMLNCYIRAEHNGIRRTGGASTAQRSLARLGDPARFGNSAARRAIDYLGDAKLQGTAWPQVFSPQASVWLLASFIEAIDGKAVSTGASVLSGMLDKPLFGSDVAIVEFPHQYQGIGSLPYDNEGVALNTRTFVADGRLQSYALDAASARRLKMKNTGNASLEFEQARNLSFTPGQATQAQLLAQMNRGVFIAEARAPQVDVKQGTFSMRAIGFWVENGQIQYPLSPLTLSGDVKDIFRKVLAIGSDLEEIGRIKGVSVLVDALTIHH